MMLPASSSLDLLDMMGNVLKIDSVGEYLILFFVSSLLVLHVKIFENWNTFQKSSPVYFVTNNESPSC